MPHQEPSLGLTIYGCRPDEAAGFSAAAPGLGIVPVITEAPLGPQNVELTSGNRCISVDHKTRLTHDTLRALGDAGVGYISTRSVGHDHIDTVFANRIGMVVEGVGYSPGSVADFTIMLMLMVLRNARSTILRAEAHDFRLPDARGRELQDLTVGVVGTGRIGSAVVGRLNGFGPRVLAFDRTRKTHAEYVDLERVLAESDVLSLHLPLTAGTRHLLDRARIARMKRGAVLINTGRGALIDTAALVDALEDGRLGGAALDVLEGEQGVFHPDRAPAGHHDDARDRSLEPGLFARLQRLPNVLITPHTAYYTDHALADVVEHTLRNCLEFERSTTCPN